MNKLIPILLIVGVLVISGCVQNPYTEPNIDTVSQQSGLDWVQVGSQEYPDTIVPKIVYNDILYGQSPRGDLYKLVGGGWEKIVEYNFNDGIIEPLIEYNGELYGRSDYGEYYKFRGDRWEEVWNDTEVQGFDVRPMVVYKNELYGYKHPVGSFKLSGNEWVKVGTGHLEEGVDVFSDPVKAIRPILVYNDELYGQHRGTQTYKFSDGDWVEVGQNGIVPKIEYNGELYGYSFYDEAYDAFDSIVGDKSYSDSGGAYKLVNDRWISIGDLPVEPKVVYDGELYGSMTKYQKNNYDWSGTYKLVGNNWLKVGTIEADPILVYKNELYGISVWKAHKLVNL